MRAHEIHIYFKKITLNLRLKLSLRAPFRQQSEMCAFAKALPVLVLSVVVFLTLIY